MKKITVLIITLTLVLGYSSAFCDNEKIGVLSVTEENPLGESAYFHDVISETEKNSIKYSTIVFENNKCADLSEEDLSGLLTTYWDFMFERVISPVPENLTDNYYIKLWNEDKTKSYIIHENGSIIIGLFGPPTEFKGEVKANYIWYMPSRGNARNSLYIKNTEIYEKYRNSAREMTEEDKYEIKDINLLPLENCSEWSRTEVEKSAAYNLMIYELTDKYQENITREDFCKLACRFIVTKFAPYSDSRAGIEYASTEIIKEKGLTEKYNEIAFSDCEGEHIQFLSATGIIKGMGDGTFAPNIPITREQAATILDRISDFLESEKPYTPTQQYYYDFEDISLWARDSVKQMYVMDIMRGYETGNFMPKNNYTVEQAIATMVRLYEILS